MKIILEGRSKTMIKLMQSLKLRLKRSGVKYSTFVEPVKRQKKEKAIEEKVIEIQKEVITENIIQDEKEEVKKRSKRAKTKIKKG